MRHKRAKVYKRAIAVYTQAFGFRTPFQILVANDILIRLNRESDIHKQLSACVQGEIKPMITQCCVEALYKMGKEYQPVVDIAKTFERRRCNHREPIPADDCLKDMIGTANKHRYVLCAQSKALREALVMVPGLPIIHFNPRAVLVLSPPSRATLRYKDTVEEGRRQEGADELGDIVDGANVVGGGESSTAPKRNRVKGPNPLSVKKKKQEPEGGNKRPREEAAASTADGEGEGEDAEVRRKKKRKRPGKGVVKQAIEEINAEMAAKAAAASDAAQSSDDE